jgi:hypothetical protein
MKISREQLEALFRDLTDGELLHRFSTDLTDLAREVALAEATRRGLALAAREAIDDAEGVEVAHGHGPLCICTRFLLPMDAAIFAARLQAEGIAAKVMDSDTIYANGAFHTSLWLGGARVMVPESQLAESQRILAAFNAGDYAIDENFDPNAG